MRILNVQLPVDQRQMIQLPKGSKILSVIVKGGLPYLYYEADEGAGFEPRVFRIVCSGEWFNPQGWEYVGSFNLSEWFVGHLYEQPASGGSGDYVDLRYVEDFKTINEELRS